MALITFQHFSESLGMQMEALVVIPQKKTSSEIGVATNTQQGKYKCLYLLHGLSDDHTIWLRRTSIERYATEYGLCVVMPNAHRSFYTDMHCGYRYYTYIAEELPALIQEFFNISDKREDNYVAGLSMGGYGALKIGLRNPERFCKIGALSAAIDMNQRIDNPIRNDVMRPIFGDGDVAPEDDVFQLIHIHEKDAVKPEVYMACGLEDFLYAENIRFLAEIREAGYDVTWRESHGIHNWEFWDEYIQYVLKWIFA